MIQYFGYGSNLHLPALRAKGVVPRASARARLAGWRLAFDVRHWFPHEGAMASIRHTGDPGDEVQGVVHACDDEALATLDRMEAYGVGYDRVAVEVRTDEGSVTAQAYVGLPAFHDPRGVPTRRYLSILVQGAEAAGLDAAYVRALREHPVLPEHDAPPFTAPAGEHRVVTADELARNAEWTALDGVVFDMSRARHDLASAKPVLGARDTTLFHLHRHDTSHGGETLDDLRAGRVSDGARRYLDAWLHAYDTEFEYVGRYVADPAV